MRSRFNPAEDGPSGSHWQTLATLMPYLWPQGRWDLRIRVVIAMGLLALAKVAIVFIPFVYKEIIDGLNITGGDDTTGTVIAIPVMMILAYGAARVAGQAFGELRDAVFAKVGQNALRMVALEVFRHLHRLSLAFHLDRQTGGLSRVIERGTKGIDFLLRFSLFNILPTLLELSLVCGVLLINYGPGYSTITLISVGIYIFFTLTITEWRLKHRREMNRTDSEASTRAIDSLLNFETVKYFGNESHEADRFNQSMSRYEIAAVRSQTSLALLNIGQGIIIAFGMCTVMLLAAQGVINKELTIGDFVLINTFMMQLYQPLGFLGFVYREIKQSLVDMDKMFELINVHAEVADKPDAKPLQITDGAVTFEAVDFGYGPDRQILHGVDFSVPAGHTVAIVGPSGAGKSTISRILFRFYDVQSGCVLIDGQDVRNITQTSLRGNVGIVPQDTVLFNDSIRYNIRYGRVDATDEEIEAAAKLAQIHDFIISLPDGYDSAVGERGLKLSGGEKQRVAIARTILKDPAILLFDEATSALDSQTEKEIQAALRLVSRDRTTLVIAHRLSTIVDADEIIVLEAGHIVERGRHEALLAASGVYSAMWQRQQEQAKALQHLQRLDKDDLSLDKVPAE